MKFVEVSNVFKVDSKIYYILIVVKLFDILDGFMMFLVNR